MYLLLKNLDILKFGVLDITSLLDLFARVLDTMRWQANSW